MKRRRVDGAERGAIVLGMSESDSHPSIVVKRYGRTRLYVNAAGRYVSMSDLRAWADENRRFVVIDTETGEDVTRVLLA